jgi:RNA polymerase sigma factor (sigma-70 family)
LLHRYVNERDEAAFELLLWRHAAMVLHVCRQVLRDAEAVEDAFQATFLVFVRKAGSISRRESLGGWLHRVAYNIALKAREASKKRRSTERELDRIEAPAEADDAGQRELRRTICEEVNRLPAKYRAPIVACFFEGKTHEEAAKQLGWPRGTVAGRLARARELLRRRLMRRGIALTAAAFTAALAVSTAPAALTGLIQTTIQTAKVFVAAHSAGALLSPRIVALAEGVLNAMYWTRVKIVMIGLLIAGLGGAGATFWGTQRTVAESPGESALRAEAVRGGDKAEKPEDADKLTRDMAQSRLNLRKLAFAMHAYAEKNNGAMPAPAIYDKKGKALLSWRVALLPYLDQNNLYKLFHLDEPWDSPHNKGVLRTSVPKVYAPVGKPAAPRFRTYYQVFVSAAPAGGMRGMAGGAGMMGGTAGPAGGMMGMAGGAGMSGGAAGMAAGGGMMGMAGGPGAGIPESAGVYAAFIKGQQARMPASFPDGTSNTLLIVEAGNAVPWTKPEDLHYAADEPLPELGGLFADVFQAAFADGDIHTLTKEYDEAILRAAITANDGQVIDMEKIEVRPRRGAGEKPVRDEPALAVWERKNVALRRELERARDRLRLLRAERALQGEQSPRHERPVDPRLEQLKRENVRLQAEVDKVHAENEALAKEIIRRQKPVQYKNK